MDPVVIITIIFIMLALITTLVTLYIESRKHIKRLEGRVERLSSRLQAMNMKELDTVLRSLKYKQERDELYKLIDDIHSTSEALEDGRQVYLFPRAYLDKTNRVVSYEWEDGNTEYTSHYTYSPTQTDNQSDNSSSYSGGGGDFSGGGSGGSWD